MRALNDETRALTVDSVTKKQHGISEREKNFLFNYIREGDIPENMRIVAKNPQFNLRINEPADSVYQTNIYVIVESFLTYGFKPSLLEAQAAREQRKSGNFIDSFRESLQSQSSVSADEDYQEAQNQLGQLNHFWQYLAKNQARLDTV